MHSSYFWRGEICVFFKNIRLQFGPYACISGFPRGATPGVPPGTEGRLLRLSGNFIPGVAGIDSLLTIYGLHPRADPGDLFGQWLNLQNNVSLPVTKWRNER